MLIVLNMTRRALQSIGLLSSAERWNCPLKMRILRKPT